jgi:integrase
MVFVAWPEIAALSVFKDGVARLRFARVAALARMTQAQPTAVLLSHGCGSGVGACQDCRVSRKAQLKRAVLVVPAVRERRERVARPAEAEALLAALPAEQRALWATALYAGLRRGELQALRWHNLDLERGLINVEHSWDRCAGLIEPKSRSGVRRVPMPTVLRTQLLSHRLRRGRPAGGFVFPAADQSRPFDSAWATTKARRAWHAAALVPIGLHECRHSYAAYAIAAGINPKALSSYMGHSSITVTLDRYGHLMPGNETEAASMLDGYLHQSGRNGINGTTAAVQDAGRWWP